MLSTKGRRATTTTVATTPVVPTRSRRTELARRAAAEPRSQVERSSLRAPRRRAATRTNRMASNRANMMVWTEAVDEMFQVRIS